MSESMISKHLLKNELLCYHRSLIQQLEIKYNQQIADLMLQKQRIMWKINDMYYLQMESIIKIRHFVHCSESIQITLKMLRYTLNGYHITLINELDYTYTLYIAHLMTQQSSIMHAINDQLYNLINHIDEITKLPSKSIVQPKQTINGCNKNMRKDDEIEILCNRENLNKIYERFAIKKNGHYICKMCKKPYKYYHNFHKHFNIHTNYAYSCEFCNKRFGRKSNYEEHKRIHTGDKPFTCHLCNKHFKQSSNWKRHTQICHSD